MSAGVFRKAADVLLERGLAKWTLEDANGAVCLSGALRCVATGSPRGSVEQIFDQMCYVAEVVGLGRSEWDAVSWNNESSRTAAEVIQALDAAYVVALQEEGVEPGDVLS